jgi:hypothetical protein
MDSLAKAYKTVRDATLLNEGISLGEAIALLDVIKNEVATKTNLTIMETASNAN